MGLHWWGGATVAPHGPAPAPDGPAPDEDAMTDLLFLLVTGGVFALLALVVRGVEKL